MYKKTSSGWFKHIDFIILDFLSLQIAFAVAYWLRLGWGYPYADMTYCRMAIFLVLADVLMLAFNESFKGVIKRGYYQEFAATFKHALGVIILAVFYLYLTKTGEEFSRIILVVTGVNYLLISYMARLGLKYILIHKIPDRQLRSLLILTTSEEADEVVSDLQRSTMVGYVISGLAILDQDRTGTTMGDIPVVANGQTVSEYVCREWVDEVLVHISPKNTYPQQLIEDIATTGVTVHVSMDSFQRPSGNQQFVGKVGQYTVLTSSLNAMTQKQAIFKRSMDIAGGLVGCLLTVLIFIFIAPALYISSPGPIFFSQIRIGKNGKKFKIYKFRSMYMDAEERKKELMKHNRVGDGMMFKMDFDPRIIGNKILPDGTKKTGIGNFIRETSLDEFPQFYNVLKGDMSLVGTRPPTLDEWEKYELHHRARMATKPGITGMWQVSGRSNITDFTEVVKLDTEYIEKWNPGLDVKILLMTVLQVIKKDGAV